MRGNLIISKSFSLYNINNNLVKVTIRGNNNSIINQYKIVNLYINGNKNNIEIIGEGKIVNIKVFGNNNKIKIKNNSNTNYNNYGIGNFLTREDDPFLIPNPLPFNNNSINFRNELQIGVSDLRNRINDILNRLRSMNIGDDFSFGKKGLDKNILDNMEISKIKDIDKLDIDKKKCTICLENYVNGDDSIALPCIHIFHAECIKTWLKDNNSCPICKNEIKFENEELNDEEFE